MMYAAAGQSFCYLIITICIRYTELESITRAAQQSWASASIAFFFLYYVFFGIGWQGVPWLYPTEINSMAMRTKGAALGTATNWIFNFMGGSEARLSYDRILTMSAVVEITPPGIRSLQWKFYIIWTIFNFAFIPIGTFTLTLIKTTLTESQCISSTQKLPDARLKTLIASSQGMPRYLYSKTRKLLPKSGRSSTSSVSNRKCGGKAVLLLVMQLPRLKIKRSLKETSSLTRRKCTPRYLVEHCAHALLLSAEWKR
jgi:hypothetical protein